MQPVTGFRVAPVDPSSDLVHSIDVDELTGHLPHTMSGGGCDDLVVIRFRFRLRPVAEVWPWGPDRHLHWSGLADGWYWIEMDGLELLRYAPRTPQRRSDDGEAASSPYVDYYVVRLWEDVLDLLPSVLEPVPDDLAEFMSGDRDDWVSPDEVQAKAVREAEWWYGSHGLDMAHLGAAPWIRWWRRIAGGHDHMTVAWKHSSGEIEFAAPRTGQAAMPTSVFIAAVEEFDRELLAAMEQRVTGLERTGPPPGVHIDMQQLRAEQQDRATWLQRQRGRKPETGWAEVRRGAGIPQGR